MWLAQELPPVEVVASSDPLSLILSSVAVAVAGASAWVTWWQGRQIRKIETREHEWQDADRKSAHIEVTRITETRPHSFKSKTSRADFYESDLIRLRNVGRARASNVVWEIALPKVVITDRGELDALYPGEHYDIHIAPAFGDPPDTHFTVRWLDLAGEHETKRLINL